VISKHATRAHTLESYLFHFFARYVFIPAQKERYSEKVDRLEFHSGLRGQTSSMYTEAIRSECREMMGVNGGGAAGKEGAEEGRQGGAEGMERAKGGRSGSGRDVDRK
jgi:hypothetical protein